MDPASLQTLGTEVAVGDIEPSLQALWDEDGAAARASLTNFVVYSRNPDRLHQNTEAISSITREHACRAILMLSPPPGAASDSGNGRDSTAHARAWITAHCNLDPDGGKFACSEQVTFLLENATPALNRNVLYAHLDSDLPLVVWWQGNLLRDEFEERLYSGIDRLIFDSSRWTNPLAGFRVLEHAMAAPTSHFVPHDLAWTRSRHFRLAFASAFDDPTARERLTTADALDINVRTGQSMAGLFLLAWISHQDRWTLQSADRHADRCDFRFERENTRPLRASIHLEERCAPLASVILTGEDLHLQITRECHAPLLHRQITCDGHAAAHVLPAEADDDTSLITNVLSRAGQNRLFARILPPFTNLLQHSENEPPLARQS